MSAGPRAGLTLVETVMAVALLSLVLLGLFSSIASGGRVDMLKREHQAASEECGRQLDQYMTDPALNFADQTFYFPIQVKTGAATTARLPKADDAWTEAGRVQIDADPDPDGAGPLASLGANMIRITVSALYLAGDGRPARVEIISMRTR